MIFTNAIQNFIYCLYLQDIRNTRSIKFENRGRDFLQQQLTVADVAFIFFKQNSLQLFGTV